MSDPAAAARLRRASAGWVRPLPDGPPPRLVWLVAHDGAGWLLSADGEQPDHLGDADTAELVLPAREPAGTATRWLARVTRFGPADPEWAVLEPLLLAARLNAGPAGQADRWRASGRLHRLVPIGPLPAR